MGVLVGVSGCSGSGKSTFAKELAERLDDKKVSIITSDTFFKSPKPKMVSPANGKVYDDFNTPENLDMSKMLPAIKQALVENDIVIAEGILLFCFKEFLLQADLTVFIDAGIETRLSRRLVRNTRVYGLDFDEVLDYYMNAARFSERRNTGSSRINADIIVDGEKNFDKPLAVIEAYLRSAL